jgi:hypothetical protein
MGLNDSVSVDEAMAHPIHTRIHTEAAGSGQRRGWYSYLVSMSSITVRPMVNIYTLLDLTLRISADELRKL